MTSGDATKYGLVILLEAKPDNFDDVKQVLLHGYDLVREEPETAQWFAVKLDEPSLASRFALFEVFTSESSRDAHLTGKAAKELAEGSRELLSEGAQIDKVDVLVSKVMSTGASGKTAGLSVGLRVLITAKPEELDNVRNILKGALPLIEAEPETHIWTVIEYPGAATFAIVGSFRDEQGRSAHSNGKVARGLFAKVDKLLTAKPDVAKFNVVALKMQG